MITDVGVHRGAANGFDHGLGMAALRESMY